MYSSQSARVNLKFGFKYLYRQDAISPLHCLQKVFIMPVFALPLDASLNKATTNGPGGACRKKKRKRTSSPVEDTFDGKDARTSIEDERSSLTAILSNPLSLGDDQARQYRIAGLELDKELPSATIADFPHRGLPSPIPAIGSGAEEHQFQYDSHINHSNEPSLRSRHLSTLTAILHRCLLEGDIPRAFRAWAMLLRVEVNGAPISLRNSTYWGIGAELLILRHSRKLEKASINVGELQSDEEPVADNDDEETKSMLLSITMRGSFYSIRGENNIPTQLTQ